MITTWKDKHPRTRRCKFKRCQRKSHSPAPSDLAPSAKGRRRQLLGPSINIASKHTVLPSISITEYPESNILSLAILPGGNADATMRRIKDGGNLSYPEALVNEGSGRSASSRLTAHTRVHLSESESDVCQMYSSSLPDVYPALMPRNPVRVAVEPAWSLPEATQAIDVIDEVINDCVHEAMADFRRQRGSNRFVDVTSSLQSHPCATFLNGGGRR